MTGQQPGPEGDGVVNLDPIDATVIQPGFVAIPLGPTVWDEMDDGQHAVAPNGVVWQRREGLWYRDPWWQHADAEEIIATCSDPEGWAYRMGWARHHVEDAYGPLVPIRLPDPERKS